MGSALDQPGVWKRAGISNGIHYFSELFPSAHRPRQHRRHRRPRPAPRARPCQLSREQENGETCLKSNKVAKTPSCLARFRDDIETLSSLTRGFGLQQPSLLGLAWLEDQVVLSGDSRRW